MKKIVIFLVVFFTSILKVNASYIVMNMDDESIIEGYNIHEKRLIASITKIMTI